MSYQDRHTMRARKWNEMLGKSSVWAMAASSFNQQMAWKTGRVCSAAGHIQLLHKLAKGHIAVLQALQESLSHLANQLLEALAACQACPQWQHVHKVAKKVLQLGAVAAKGC